MIRTRERPSNSVDAHLQQRKSYPTTSKPPKYVVSKPIRGVLHNPLQLKVLVPRVGRSAEQHLIKSFSKQVDKHPDDVARIYSLKAACESIFVSVQAQRADDSCSAGLSSHTHFDLVLRMLDKLRAAHLLCKIVYHNVRGEVKEMGPYMLHMTEMVTSYRLEEMNCHVSEKTGHHHVYLLMQLVSAESTTEEADQEHRGTFDEEPRLSLPDGGRRPRSRRTSGSSVNSSVEDLLAAGLPATSMSPNQSQLPDFASQWSPLATLKIVAPAASEERPLYCVPQVLCLCCDEFKDLLANQAHQSGELVLTGTTYSDLLLLLQLTYPGTPRTVNMSNVQQVLRVATRFRATGLLKTAETLLCFSVSSGCVKQAKRAELVSLASQYNLQELSNRLNACKTIG